MTTRGLHATIVVAIFVAAAVLSSACDGNDGVDGSSTPQSTHPPAIITQSTEDPIDIRTVDLEGLRPLQDMLRRTNGVFSQADVVYADVTGDGVEDALVPISSGGTMGVIGFILFMATPLGAEPVIQQARNQSTSIEVIDGQLVETLAVYGPDDPECCPTHLRTITYLWDGVNFIIERDETAPNPDGGVKTSTP